MTYSSQLVKNTGIVSEKVCEIILSRTFVDYAQFESGVVVPGYVAREAGLSYKTYVALDSMILNFA